jgi:predicted transglutaminase-like cysteine proteinase
VFQTPLETIGIMASAVEPPQRKRIGPVLLVLATLLLAGQAASEPPPDLALAGRSTITPLPMQFFCRRRPDDCAPDVASLAEWDHKLQSRLRRINQQVNEAIRPLADPPHGWSIGPKSGDCNDYVLTKRRKLIRLGIPAGALHIAITQTPSGEAHAVLLVRTTEGDVVLDNLSSAVVSLPLSGYAIRAMSSPDPMRWIAPTGHIAS